jgi:[FeFe] hydrogenase H-cluster maturation GTPase HydF
MIMITERDHIGIFGKMNSGKSSLMNLITQQATSIVDTTPGTTSDTKVALMEIHGLGPVKLFDTAGLDEATGLGAKKREKVMNTMKECDLVLLVINPSTRYFDTEQLIMEYAHETDKQILAVYNLFDQHHRNQISNVEAHLPLLRFYPKIEISAVDPLYRQPLLEFIVNQYDRKYHAVDLLPFIENNEFYLLNIPMDEETPPGRLLRPQSIAEEYITRKWAYPILYRMDLHAARGEKQEQEKERFMNLLACLKKAPKAIITDSQAMDIMDRWVPEPIALTTFSIMMIHYASNGKLSEFYDGTKVLEQLRPGDRILIAEACNHSRIREDIGTVQIPAKIAKRFPGVIVEHSLGREFQDLHDLEKFKLIIHCGGCMISQQKLQARLRDLRNMGVAITNYGIFLSWFQGQKALERVMKPWSKDPDKS